MRVLLVCFAVVGFAGSAFAQAYQDRGGDWRYVPHTYGFDRDAAPYSPPDYDLRYPGGPADRGGAVEFAPVERGRCPYVNC